MKKDVIGQNIRAARRAKGLTQAGLGEALGVEAPSVNRWENGKSQPRAELIPKIEKVLGISLYSNAPLENSSSLTMSEFAGLKQRVKELEVYMIKGKNSQPLSADSLFKKYKHIIERLEKGSDLDLELVEEALGLSINDRASDSDSA
jgi:HTH-type transcriptional regulator/antitoxin HipB